MIDKSALMPGVSRREVWAWSAFDFANSGYTTVVLTAVFNAYFVSVVAADAPWATFLWTLIIAVSNAVGIFVMPVVGAIADASAQKKRWLFGATAICILGTAGLRGINVRGWSLDARRSELSRNLQHAQKPWTLQRFCLAFALRLSLSVGHCRRDHALGGVCR